MVQPGKFRNLIFVSFPIISTRLPSIILRAVSAGMEKLINYLSMPAAT